MDTVYEIRIEGVLPEYWSDWFEGLAVHNHEDGETTLTGALRDQAALFGILHKIHGLNLRIISLRRIGEMKS